MDSVTVIFLFTDIEGSTGRWERGREAMADALRRHDELMHAAIASSRGRVFKTVGDAFCAAFSTVSDAVAAARNAQRALTSEDWTGVDGLHVRMAIHAGSVESRGGDYFGPPLNRVARLLTIGHGGQVLLSSAAADLSKGDLPADVELAYLGAHRLRDIEGTEHVYQLRAPDLRAEFPALLSLEALPNNLPLQLTSFVGRTKEMADLRRTVETTRLLTLAGTGGVGKTRLALQLASESIERFPDGVWHLDLCAVREAGAVAAELATTLSVRATATQTELQAVASAIGTKRTLIVLDGCEHVIAAAGILADHILHACPNVTVIATSRQPMAIGGELVYNVETLEREGAIQLFVERATSASSRFSLSPENAAAIADICGRLDGIPLALELAAPKTAVLSPAQLLEKLDQRFRLLTATGGNRLPRQQTLRALIDWSFDLLDERERTLARRLSIFSGGCTLQAAAAVCGDDEIDDWSVFELLAALVSKSLVVMEPYGDGQRYRMLNSIREYGREQLRSAGTFDDTAARHAAYFARAIHDLHPVVVALDDAHWKVSLAPETDNIRALLEWALVEGHDALSGLSVLSELEWPELVTSPQEAIRWFEAGLTRIDLADSSIVKARVLRRYVRLQWMTGRPNEQIGQTAALAVEAAQASGDPSEIAHSLCELANWHRDGERFDEADARYQESLAYREQLSPIARNAVLRNFAISNLQRGDVESARSRFTEVAACERPGSEAHASALLNLGELEFAIGNFQAAKAAAREAKDVYGQLQTAPLALAICNLAAYAMAVDELEEARELLREALGLLKRSGARWMITALEHHAVLAALAGDYDRGAPLLGFTEEHYQTHGKTRQKTERYGYERAHELLHNAYGAAELERRKSAGKSLTLEQALTHAAAISKPTQEPVNATG